MSVVVGLPSQLTAYSGGATRLAAEGATVAEVLDDLDRRFPGLRFRVIDEQDRVRRHMRLFIGRDACRDIATPIADGQELLIFGALSGG
ncbi:MAG TPA: MoaD/ThiS family protein [Caulobacteraceae bacterium]|nr:MoaD/ThiS family protein [Caulobacteraceae bacterium]